MAMSTTMLCFALLVSLVNYHKVVSLILIFHYFNNRQWQTMNLLLGSMSFGTLLAYNVVHVRVVEHQSAVMMSNVLPTAFKMHPSHVIPGLGFS